MTTKFGSGVLCYMHPSVGCSQERECEICSKNTRQEEETR